jgi:hypothetical protein
MYNGLQIAVPATVATDAALAETEWKKLLAAFGFPDAEANAVFEVFSTNIGLTTYDDFRCFFNEKSDFQGLIIGKATLAPGNVILTQPGKWASRLRQVWGSPVKAHTDFQDVVTKGSEAQDLDRLLDQKPLADLHLAFWERYHMKFVSAHTPGDSLVSRKKRELDLFHLTVANVLKSRS